MKIKSLLIANRGEIAVRITKRAKKLGNQDYMGLKLQKNPMHYISDWLMM